MLRFNITISLEIGKQNQPENDSITSASWGRLKRIIKKRHKDICHYCGENAPNGQIDHVLPLSRGGTDTIDNLVWTCKECNNSKGDKTIAEWQDEAKAIYKTTRQEEARILSLDSEGLSLRQISTEVWGDGKHGYFYNEKIRQVLSGAGRVVD